MPNCETEFDELVRDALDEIPQPLLNLLDNVVILVEPEPPADIPHTLGLYVGTPLTARGNEYTFFPPDQIFIYRGPLQRRFPDLDELRRQVTITVIHEIAHHFGIDDAQLHAWGWG